MQKWLVSKQDVLCLDYIVRKIENLLYHFNSENKQINKNP